MKYSDLETFKAINAGIAHCVCFSLDDCEDIINAPLVQLSGEDISKTFWTENFEMLTLKDVLSISDSPNSLFRLKEETVIAALKAAKNAKAGDLLSPFNFSLRRKDKSFCISALINYSEEAKQFYIVAMHLCEFDDIQNSLIEEAEHDSSTSLLVKRQMMESLDALEFGEGNFFLFIDVDDFKLLNDMYGHVAGDEILKHFAQALTSVEDETWTPYRFGGDEFAVIARNSNITKIKAKIAAMKKYMIIHSADDISFSFSTGIVETKPFMRDSLRVVRCADVAMYRAKKLKSHYFFMDEKLAKKTSV